MCLCQHRRRFPAIFRKVALFVEAVIQTLVKVRYILRRGIVCGWTFMLRGMAIFILNTAGSH